MLAKYYATKQHHFFSGLLTLLLGVGMHSTLVGCSSKNTVASTELQNLSAPVMGAYPAPVAPRLIKDSGGKIIWDHPSAFGPVPQLFQLVGDKTCSSLQSNLVAIGYHPDAMDLTGKRFEGGAFYCFYAPK